MQKRARLIDNKMKRIQINRRGKSDTRDSLSPMLAYIRLAFMWVSIVAIDAVSGFRIELIWPFWLIIRAAYESVHQKNQQSVASLTNPNTARFSVLFVCVTATSDLICYLFIPVRMLIFVATTYVWINLIWHTHGGFIRTMNTLCSGERSQSWLIVLLSAFVIGFEIVLRARCECIYLNKDQQISYLIPSAVVPVVPRSFNAFFGAHCIGYPMILITFSLRYYFNEWKLRRKRGDVSYKNEQLYRILVESLPAEYEGPKDYTTSCMEDECYLIEATTTAMTAAVTSSTTQPMALTGPLSNSATAKKNGIKNRGESTTKRGNKKNGNVVQTANGNAGAYSMTPPIEKKIKRQDKNRSDELEENDESEVDEYTWNNSSIEERRSGGVSLIRFTFDVATWMFSMVGGIVRSSSSSSSSPSSSSPSSPATSVGSTRKHAGGASDDEKRERHQRGGGQFDKRIEADEEIEDEMEKENKLQLQNGRITSSPEVKSRSSTLTNNGRTINHPNNKRTNGSGGGGGGSSGGGGKQIKNHHEKPTSNGHTRLITSSTIRDSSHDTNASNEAEIRNMSREIDILRSELSLKRNNEEDQKLQISMLESNESRLNQQISHLKMRLDQMENKCSSLEKHRESDKANLEQNEQKYATLMARKTELEQALILERKQRNDETGKKMDLAEHQRERERQLEIEVDRLRAELKSKEETNRKMEVEVNCLKNYKEENDIDAINMELRIHKDKSQHLESSLASENKLKQELFRALSEAKASNKTLENRIVELENELRSRPMAIDANDDTTNSDQSSPHQHSALGSPVPSTKTPLSIHVTNRSSPYNEKRSPIGNPTGQLTSMVAAPPDYSIAVNHPKAITNSFSYRYNQFQQHASNGEHLLFDAPAPSSVSTCASLSSSHDVLASRHMGKFGAPSNPAARSN